MRSTPEPQRWLPWAMLLAVLALTTAQNAWVSDDAFITLRTVDHALQGYGLRFNVAERVQAYTHPLWMGLLLVAHAITGGPWLGTMALGALTSLAAVAGLRGLATNRHGAALAVGWLIASKAFVDYSTSGLENPLTHLILAAAALQLAAPDDRPAALGRSAALVALAALTRPDAVLLTAPLLAAHAHRARAHLGIRHAVAVALGFAPLLAWEGFTLLYYGSLVPNTALAKLGAGVPTAERVAQGLRYLWHPTAHDPATALALVALPVLALAQRDRLAVALGSAGLLHIAYVVWIGGDFMAGRFWTPPVFLTAALLGRAPGVDRVWPALALALAGLATLLPYAPLRTGPSYEGHPPWRGIVDERGYYHDGAAWISGTPLGGHAFAVAGRRARARGPHGVVRATIGLFGYHAGPGIHVTDPLALAEPLLARLPARYDPDWRVGHYRRGVPAGYDPGADRAPDDPQLATLHAHVRLLTRAPLLTRRRLTALLTAAPEPPALWRYRFEGVQQLGGPPSSPVTVDRRGVRVPMPPQTVAVDAALAGPATRWRLLYARDGAVLATHDLDADATLPAPPPGADQLLLYPRGRGIDGTLSGLRFAR